MTRKVGNIVIIEPEADDVCEVCGKVAELRPYGKFDSSRGRRLRVCFACGAKNPVETERAFKEFLGEGGRHV